MQELPNGTQIGGYRVVSLIGRGGMGVVYLAEHAGLERRVALKVLAPQFTTDASFRARFERESRLAASLDHPNVIPIYEAGEADGMLFIAMRYVDGPDLRAVLDREGRFDVARTLAISAQLASALDAAHAHGLIHRDVKPGNVLLAAGHGADGGEHVYLTDFGLTKHSASKSGLTQLGQMVGTIDYIAPEQISGEQVDGRADVYALGCVFFEMLAGQPPYPRDTDLATMAAHLHQPPPTISPLRPDLPPAVDELIATVLAKKPDDRFASASALVAAARASLAGATDRSTTGAATILVAAPVITPGDAASTPTINPPPSDAPPSAAPPTVLAAGAAAAVAAETVPPPLNAPPGATIATTAPVWPGQANYSQPQGNFQPAQGGYPPGQGGYPSGQGGYPPNQGSYPPPGGNYPPQPPMNYYPPPPPPPGGSGSSRNVIAAGAGLVIGLLLLAVLAYAFIVNQPTGASATPTRIAGISPTPTASTIVSPSLEPSTPPPTDAASETPTVAPTVTPNNQPTPDPTNPPTTTPTLTEYETLLTMLDLPTGAECLEEDGPGNSDPPPIVRVECSVPGDAALSRHFSRFDNLSDLEDAYAGLQNGLVDDGLCPTDLPSEEGWRFGDDGPEITRGRFSCWRNANRSAQLSFTVNELLMLGSLVGARGTIEDLYATWYVASEDWINRDLIAP